MSQKTIYLDHNATTPVRPEVVDAMLPYLREHYGNPNSVYALGQKTRQAVERAREQVAALVGAADASEIVFTSCGSEADVLAISGGAWQAFDESKGKRRRVVASQIEHDAVREILRQLYRRGFQVAELKVDQDALVHMSDVEDALDAEGTSLVSVMHANNEVGTVEPIEKIAEACRARGVLFHTDAVQSAGKIPLKAKEWGVDLLAISGHKINAPKGVGALYVRKGVRLAPTITGHQEKNRRGGTENVASIVGLGKACELAAAELAHAQELAALRDRLEAGVLRIAGTRANGHRGRRLPNSAHFSFEGLDGHHLVVALDLQGVCVSAGPACSSGASMASHVLTAMGVPDALATGSLRVSLGWGSTSEDVDVFLDKLPGAVAKLRSVQAHASLS